MRDLGNVLEAVLDGVVVLDAGGAVETLNSEACRILEVSAEMALGAPISALLGPRHPVGRLAGSVLTSGRAAVERERLLERRGADCMIDLAGSPLFDPDHKVGGVVLVLRDRTIQNNLQELVSERERSTALGHIAAGIAHEVKNPLGGIRGAAEILASRAGDPKTLDAAELIVREVDRIATLVDDLMVFTREDDLHFQPVNVHRVLDDVLDLLAMDPLGSGIAVERLFDPSIPELEADTNRLTQVFLNLTRNALQAMEGRGGTLSIITRMPFDHRLSSPSGRPVPTVLVTIADTGGGIAPEALEQLATPFFTTRSGGTGLGLAVSRHWVARHGGTLRIESQLAGGTTVRVALPLRRPS